MYNIYKSPICRLLGAFYAAKPRSQVKALGELQPRDSVKRRVKYFASFCALFNVLFYSLAAGAAECVDSTPGIDSMDPVNITLLNDKGKPIELSVLLADDAFERAAGFQSVCPEVIDKTLILFRYPTSIDGKFHMQNVRAPLDIVFFAANGRFIQYEKMETYTQDSQPLYGPGRPFQFALEAPVGFFAKHGISGFPSQLVVSP